MGNPLALKGIIILCMSQRYQNEKEDGGWWRMVVTVVESSIFFVEPHPIAIYFAAD